MPTDGRIILGAELMLTFSDKTSSRRSFLQVGSLGLGGLTLPGLLAAKANAANASKLIKDKSVIFLFMHGGPSQTETFDPKMTAPSGVRSVTGEIKTSLPGITFGSTFEKLAERAHRMTVVRSFKTGTGAHDIKPIVCDETLGANLGSMYARIAGTNRGSTGMPTNVALFPRAVEPKSKPRVTQFGKFDSTGKFGRAYAPFIPGAGGDLQDNMKLTLPKDRLGDRKALLGKLDTLKRSLESAASSDSVDRFQLQAFETILGGAADAFDLSKEDPRTIAKYDTEPLIRPEGFSKRWNNHQNYLDNARTLGKLLLMARRLCEAGAGFVTVTTNFVWDMHADKNNAPCDVGMDYVGRPFDHAVSAFMDDVESRGLSDKILLVACGEMGRTPKVNAKGGRDHWGNIAPLLLHGGGLNMGQVIGESTRDASEPHTTPITSRNLMATIMHTLLDTGELRLQTGMPNELLRHVLTAKPIPNLH